jgi:hypothetical protein
MRPTELLLKTKVMDYQIASRLACPSGAKKLGIVSLFLLNRIRNSMRHMVRMVQVDKKMLNTKGEVLTLP